MSRLADRVLQVLPWRQRPSGAAHPTPGGEEPGPLPLFGSTFRALRNRNYRLYFAGQTISLSGTWMQTIAQALLVLQITHSKIALGTVTLLQFLPITIFVLFAGVIADRVPKRNFILCTQALAMAQAFTLAYLVWTGRVELWHVYVLALMLGLANAFEQPTRQAFVVEMVGREDLMNAVALNSGMFNGARLIGPGFGGLIIAAFGLKWAFLLNGISFVPVIAGLLMMNLSTLHAVNKRATANPITELREGLTYAVRTPAVFVIIILVAIVGTFGYNFTVMLPLLSEFVLHVGATAFGFMTAAVGLGALISALILASRKNATKFTLFAGGIGFTVMLFAVAFSHWLLLTLLFLLLLGIANTAFAATANTSLQVATPDHLRGRVMGLYMLLFAGSTPIGGFLTGYMAQHLGVPMAIAINATACGFGVALGLLYYVTHRTAVDDGAIVDGLGGAAIP